VLDKGRKVKQLLDKKSELKQVLDKRREVKYSRSWIKGESEMSAG
jgi:hypothetical protein